jgi:hypothetical protein
METSAPDPAKLDLQPVFRMHITVIHRAAHSTNRENTMNKILAAIAVTGLIAALPSAAQARDRGYVNHGHASAQHRDCDHPHHFQRHAHHHHRYQHVNPQPVAYYAAPRVAPVFVPAIPLPLAQVNIVWRVGY